MKKFIVILLLMMPLAIMAQSYKFFDIKFDNEEQLFSELTQKGFVKTDSVCEGKLMDENVKVRTTDIHILDKTKLTVAATFRFDIEATKYHLERIIEKYKEFTGIKEFTQVDDITYYTFEGLAEVVHYLTLREGRVMLLVMYREPELHQ